MPKLTEITCRNAISGDNAVKKMGDGEGLYLWVFINGSKRWNFRYKENGKEKGLSLGVYPKVSLADARKEARRLRSSMDDGITPERVKNRFWKQRLQ